MSWLLLLGTAEAEPRMAVRQGVQCGTCHVNNTGGGMRTDYGNSFSATNLPTWTVDGSFDPWLGERVRVGTDMRVGAMTSFAADTELDGIERHVDASSSFEMPVGNLFLQLEAIPDRLYVYFDETVAPEGASAREAWMMFEDTSGLYVKAGRMLLPYGLRIPDDQAYIRQQTGFTYANQDMALELGLDRRHIFAAAALSNGSGGGGDSNLPKQLTGSVAAVNSWGRIGMSAAWNNTSTKDMEFKTATGGVHGGLRLGRFVQLAEVDLIHGISTTETYDQWAIYTETDFEVLKGLYLRFAFGAFDPMVALEENERDRFVLGMSWFPRQYRELRIDYRINRDIPQRVDENANELVIELHAFL